MKKIADILYLPIFIIKYKSHYKNIKLCIEDYFEYYTLKKKESK